MEPCAVKRYSRAKIIFIEFWAWMQAPRPGINHIKGNALKSEIKLIQICPAQTGGQGPYSWLDTCRQAANLTAKSFYYHSILTKNHRSAYTGHFRITGTDFEKRPPGHLPACRKLVGFGLRYANGGNTEKSRKHQNCLFHRFHVISSEGPLKSSLYSHEVGNSRPLIITDHHLSRFLAFLSLLTNSKPVTPPANNIQRARKLFVATSGNLEKAFAPPSQ
jgi:hypothetical protein